LLPLQRGDFYGVFKAMHGEPVTIRTIDPPLHEFLPTRDIEFEELSGVIGLSADHLKRRAAELHEANPMLGHRGCRLGITFPEIYEMQARAIFEAAVEAARTTGAAVVPEIMVPLVGLESELVFVKARIDAAAKEVMAESRVSIDYLTGTMIELPRAALRAHVIAEQAEFFSFGTNDLTQTTFGISRDDASSFLETYRQKGLIERDPFVSLDIDGVGELVRIAADKGRATRPDIKLGICGEHGGDPASINFCEEVGLDYVSCSPFRVPIARLAAAQAAVRKG
jgi:pyruvate,orthophosphate dikinase